MCAKNYKYNIIYIVYIRIYLIFFFCFLEGELVGLFKKKDHLQYVGKIALQYLSSLVLYKVVVSMKCLMGIPYHFL